MMMLPASMAAAASFPMLLEALLHMPSLPVIVMLFVSIGLVLEYTSNKRQPLAYAAESVALFICCSPSRSRKWLPWEAVLATVASSLVLYNEYRLMVPGLIWGPTSILLLGLARACYVLGMERTGSHAAIEARCKAQHGFIMMTLMFGVIFTGFAAHKIEHIHLMRPLDIPTKSLMVANILSIVGSALSGKSVLTYTPLSFDDSQVRFSNIPLQFTELVPSLASALLVGIVSVYWHPTYVSWLQIAAWLVGATWLAGSDRVHSLVLQCMECTQRFSIPKKGLPDPKKPSWMLTSGGLIGLIILVSWTLSSLSSASINSYPLGLPATFDVAYEPQSDFDIVISMYQESPASVKSMIAKLKSTTYLSTLTPRVIIYTKDSTSDLDHLKKQIGADIVHRLPNTGREGGTYLSHILANWDTIASKTMFIQAHAHNMRELIPRLNSYLIPSTGMLSLGFTGVTCECGSCTDRWGWEDKWNVIPKLYENIYGAPCESNQQITLSYKGQFIVSAKRIRGIHKKNYQDLLDAISSKEGWGHKSTAFAGMEEGMEGGKEGWGDAGDKNTPDNPFFGFTVERIWGLLMQCGTDGVVAARCPSLLSGMGSSGDVGDCQCLDVVG